MTEDKALLTNQAQPNNTAQSNDGQYRQANPERRRHIQAKPEESLICSRDPTSCWVRGFKYPMRVTTRNVHFVPPTETNQATSRDVFEVIEVRCEEKQRDDEDQDTIDSG